MTAAVKMTHVNVEIVERTTLYIMLFTDIYWL